MSEHHRVSSSYNGFSSKPCDCFTDIFYILTCTCYHEVSGIYRQQFICKVLRNKRFCLCRTSTVIGVYLPIVNAADSILSKIFLLKAIPSFKCTEFS